ncbi:Tn3 family transposase [Kiloniella sp.]|uniref:Tn3 family transposase n=1 Tax=Kiloniella sp. TaxID=1938587 RepID=UPI003B01667C
MNLHITDSGLVQNWSLSFSEFDLVNIKSVSAQLGFSCQLKFFASFGYFAETTADLPKEAIAYLAEQLGSDGTNLNVYDFSGRSGRRHRTEIIKFLGFRRMRKSDRRALKSWIFTQLCPGNSSVSEMIDQVFIWCRDQKIYWSSTKEAGRLVRSERKRFLDDYFAEIFARISPEANELMDQSLLSPENEAGFHAIKSDPGQPTLDNIISVTERLAFIQKLNLPRDLLSKPGTNWIEIIVRRVGNETASDMQRHSIERRLGLYSVYLMTREAQIIDGLVDLLIETIHKISVRSRRKVISEITRDIEKVYGKERLLVDIAGAAIQNSSGSVSDVIFPVVSEEKLAAIIKEHRAKGTLDLRIYEVMRRSYANHYRRMLPQLLAVLEFRSNNTTWRPVLQALEWIQREVNNNSRFVPVHEVPIEDVIPKKWRSAVIGEDGRVNRISYELCILGQLRDRIRSKEIWIVGANRHRNPDEDLPQDFESQRDSYYKNLNLTRDAHTFITSIKADLERELRLLNTEIPGNKKVRIHWKGKNRISITPFEALPEPSGLVGVKAELGRRWPMLSLLDILKETALDTNFLRAFETSASRVALSPETLDYRLILSLYGLGTNAGLKRIAAGCDGVSYDELLHIYKKFINAESLREACARVANATLGIRSKMVWGETGTACASDSKKIGAWDQNLMALLRFVE